jgi:hypothetical protein
MGSSLERLLIILDFTLPQHAIGDALRASDEARGGISYRPFKTCGRALERLAGTA